ncbi:uncharacterized protein SCHCODRAFT_01186429 [Schizophyllum commune H4-8]|uniref:F-box domain-containing protein n=1 Tax=Schizophyllum commune (strain H4-8 / FGSC 9210) TaxID=578458 RepID=D8PM61_SCHCM|nr:uncharacterized protein SCHCODRAFT_01186429 [Schizophyllum commune H4-8]KAI5897315.1 hypothetical protein SCHCODRAFT_01186429 [Schizophyllum commune H4-8]
MQNFLVTHDLSRIESLHVRATRITSSLALILRSTPRIHTLDLAYLYFRTFPKNIAVSMNYPLQPLPRFPQLVSRPRVVRYCSRLDLVHEIATDVDWIEKARATRYPFATLLHELDISQVEQLEISAESLALPCAVAYTWSSLRVLVITGFWISNDSETPLDDARLKTPASIYEHVHLGTLINATPNLRILRIRWRYIFLPEPRRTVWPPSDVSHLKTFGGALEVFELYNPSVLDGVYTRLPQTLRSLSLLTHPHGTHGTNMLKEYELHEVNIANPYIAVLRPLDIERILTLTELPCLHDLRLSFRGQEGTRLFNFIAETFPLLEILELHAETGPGCIWQTPQLTACARALSPLSRLRSLRLNTFRRVLSQEQWMQCQERMYFHETLEQKARFGILRAEVVAALFGEEGSGDAKPSYSRWPRLQDVWLPQAYGDMDYLCRIWQIFDVERGRDGRPDLCGSNSEVELVHVIVQLLSAIPAECGTSGVRSAQLALSEFSDVNEIAPTFSALPMDMVYEVPDNLIFSHLHPSDLFNLKRTSSAFRDALATRRATSVWQACLANVPDLPPVPPEYDCLEYAARVFGDQCTYIAASFPRLEVLESHAERSPGYLWSASDLSLTSTIRGVLSQREIAAALFGDTTAADGPARFPAFCELWLSDSILVIRNVLSLIRRMWEVYVVERDSPAGRVDIRLEDGWISALRMSLGSGVLDYHYGLDDHHYGLNDHYYGKNDHHYGLDDHGRMSSGEA